MTRGRRADIKADLQQLRFELEYFKEILNKIANNKFQKGEVSTIGDLLGESGMEVYKIMGKINTEHKAFIIGRYGDKYWNKCENDVVNLKMTIRDKLAELSDMKRERKGEIIALTENILAMIADFNEALAAMGDAILEPARVRPK